jgi:hypothetical protein
MMEYFTIYLKMEGLLNILDFPSNYLSEVSKSRVEVLSRLPLM